MHLSPQEKDKLGFCSWRVCPGSNHSHNPRRNPGLLKIKKKAGQRRNSSSGYQISYNEIKGSTAVSIQQILFSKLISACELDWIPETDSIYGEPAFTKQLPEGLKKLVYEPNRKRSPQESFKTKVISKQLSPAKQCK